MVLKVEFVFAISMYYITGIHAQSSSCRLIDFNKTDSVFEFDGCFVGNLFDVKSYEDTPSLVPFRSDSVYYLTKDVEGLSCFTSWQTFHLDEFTEFDAIVYLNSPTVFDSSYVEIQVYDTDEGEVTFLGRFEVAPDWFEFKKNFGEFDITIENAQIEIRAFTTVEAVLAIEYIHILNSEKDDEDCDRATTATETTPSTTTTESTTTTTSPTTITSTTTMPSTTLSTPNNSNGNSLWIILSIVFFVITVVVVAASIYMIYVYKRTMEKVLLKATTQSTQRGRIPRLTVATSSSGDQIIVGLQKFQNAGVLRY